MLGCGAHVRIIALPHVRCACGSACEMVLLNKLKSSCNKKFSSVALNPIAALNLERLLSARLRYITVVKQPKLGLGLMIILITLSPDKFQQSLYKHRPQTSSMTSYCIILSFSFLYVICKKFQCLLILQFTTLCQHEDCIYFSRRGLDYQKDGVVGLWTLYIAESF